MNEKSEAQKLMMLGLLLISILVLMTSCQLTGELTSNKPTTSESHESAPGIQLKAELAVPDKISLCSPVEVEFTVRNLSDQAVYLLNWYIPLEGILGDIFRVSHDGQALEYLGPQVTRAAPLADQYILIEAGQSKTAVVDLSSVYDFSQAAVYKIAYQSPLISHVVMHPSEFATTLDELGPVQIPSQPVEVEILAEDGKHCQVITNLPAGDSEDETHLPYPPLTLTGVVDEVSLSAQSIRLEKEVQGFSMIVLTADTRLVTASGSPIELDQIQQGLNIEASGRPGENQTLIADRIQVVIPEK